MSRICFISVTVYCPRTLSCSINAHYAAITVNCMRYLNIVLGFKWQHAEKAFGKRKKKENLPSMHKMRDKIKWKTRPKNKPQTQIPTPPSSLYPAAHNCPHWRSPQHRTRTKSWNRSRIRNWNQSNWLNAWQNFYRIPFPPAPHTPTQMAMATEENREKLAKRLWQVWQVARGKWQAGGKWQHEYRMQIRASAHLI